MRIKKIILSLLCISMLSSFFSCTKTSYYKAYVKTEDEFLTFKSSDSELDAFINDYFKRHLRYNDQRIGDLSLGNSVMFNKEWEALSLMWFDSTGRTVPDDRYEMMKMWLDNIAVDKFGYVWSTFDELQPATSGPLTYFGQGWAFPDYAQSGARAKGWEFNEKTEEGWTLTNGATSKIANGFFTVDYNGTKPLEFTSPSISVDSFHSPYLQIDLRLVDKLSFGKTSQIEDIYVYWQTAGDTGWSDSKKVSQKEMVTIPQNDFYAVFSKHMYFPMYLNKEWNNKKITKLKIAIVPKEGKTLDITANMNFVRMNYDTRQINNNSLFITASDTYAAYTGDKEFLEKNITRLRKSMQFYLSSVHGENGLVDQSEMVGHDGLSGVGHSMGNGYWDILALPSVDLYANMFYYKAIKAQADIERMAEAYGIKSEPATVVSMLDNKTVEYTLSADNLDKLAETVKSKIQKTFWDEEKGRFYAGTTSAGEKIDFGFIVFNLEAVQCGLASDEQAKKIMDWVTGKRIIDGENSTGKDIYFYEFAPRATTVRNENKYVNGGGAIAPFGGQIQDGGTVVFLSYYDILARMRTEGVDNAFTRLKEIEKWYEKIKAAGGEGKRFYRDYYDLTDITLQGGGTQGGIGLDEEFLENALLTAIVPFGFFGMNTSTPNVLSVTPNLPKSLDYWEMENLMYHGMKYDLTVTKNSVELNAVRGKVPSGEKIKVTLKKPSGSFTVKINGEKSSNYTVEGDKIVVTIDFARTKIQVS